MVFLFKKNLPTFTLVVPNTVFVVVEVGIPDVEDKDTWLFELSVLPLSLIIGKGVLVDVDDDSAKSVVIVVVVVTMDKG